MREEVTNGGYYMTMNFVMYIALVVLLGTV